MSDLACLRVYALEAGAKWVQKAHRDGDQDYIVDESPAEIDLDPLESGLGDQYGIEHIVKPVFHGYDVSCLYCDI